MVLPRLGATLPPRRSQLTNTLRELPFNRHEDRTDLSLITAFRQLAGYECGVIMRAQAHHLLPDPLGRSRLVMGQEAVLLRRLCSQRGSLREVVMSARTSLPLAIARACARADHAVAPVVSVPRPSQARRKLRAQPLRACFSGWCGLTGFLNLISPAPE